MSKNSEIFQNRNHGKGDMINMSTQWYRYGEYWLKFHTSWNAIMVVFMFSIYLMSSKQVSIINIIPFLFYVYLFSITIYIHSRILNQVLAGYLLLSILRSFLNFFMNIVILGFEFIASRFENPIRQFNSMLFLIHLLFQMVSFACLIGLSWRPKPPTIRQAEKKTR